MRVAACSITLCDAVNEDVTFDRRADDAVEWTRRDHDLLTKLTSDFGNFIARFDASQVARQAEETAIRGLIAASMARTDGIERRVDSLEATRDQQMGAVFAGRVGVVILGAASGMLSALAALGGFMATGLLGHKP